MITPEETRSSMAEFITDSLNWTAQLQDLLKQVWDIPPDTKATYSATGAPDALEEVILNGEALKGFRAAIALVLHELEESPSAHLMLKMAAAQALENAPIENSAPATVQ